MWSSPELLFDVEEDLAAVGFGADGKVEPEGGGALLDDITWGQARCAE